MAEYQYVGTKCFYPNILVPGGGSLVANPGDVREFDDPPGPPDRVYWVEVEAKPAPKPGKAAAPDVKDVK